MRNPASRRVGSEPEIEEDVDQIGIHVFEQPQVGPVPDREFVAALVRV